MSEDDPRHSVASEAYLIHDEQGRAEAEARNGLVQFDLACIMIVDAIEKGQGWKLRPSAILALHRAALDGISSYAGNFPTVLGGDYRQQTRTGRCAPRP